MGLPFVLQRSLRRRRGALYATSLGTLDISFQGKSRCRMRKRETNQRMRKVEGTLVSLFRLGVCYDTWEQGQDTLHHGDEGKLPSFSGEKGTVGLSRRRGPSRGLAPRRKGNSYLSRCTRLTGNMRFVYSWLCSQIAALTGSTTMFTIAILHDMSCEDRSPGLTLGAFLPG